jgi:hypothetical protein
MTTDTRHGVKVSALDRRKVYWNLRADGWHEDLGMFSANRAASPLPRGLKPAYAAFLKIGQVSA